MNISFQEFWTAPLLNKKLLSIKIPLVVLFDIKASDSKISSVFIYATAPLNRTERHLVGKRFNKKEPNKRRHCNLVTLPLRARTDATMMKIVVFSASPHPPLCLGVMSIGSYGSWPRTVPSPINPSPMQSLGK